MNAQIENWDDLRYFLAVARKGSLSAAARDLGVNHSTVFRRVGALEEGVGARLFDRQPRGYALTAVGEDMLDIAARIEDDVIALDRQVLGRDQQLSGIVRITTVEEVATLLAPDLAAFYARYPGIELQVISEQRVFSLSRREADVAIRPQVRPTEPDVIGRRLCSMSSAFYASKTYVQKHGAPARSSDLDDHCLISFDDSLAHVGTHRWLTEHAPNAHFSFRCNTMLGQLTAAKAGFGIGILPCFMGDAEPDLVRVFEFEEDQDYALWLLVHGDLRQTARVRAFRDFIVDAIEQHRDLLAGARH